jgi:peptidoglycan/LPS O-acetylase OafA/YrhL
MTGEGTMLRGFCASHGKPERRAPLKTAPAISGTDEGARNVGLDLVRAGAISLVLVSHWSEAASQWFGVRWSPVAASTAGFLGVELFFALSGFLIGMLLLELIERDPSLRGWWRFMVRRWLRTLPLYVFWLAALALLWPPAENLPGYLLEYGTFTQNLMWPMPGDGWFNVSWSLGVEEWFYLLFSMLLIGGASLTHRRTTCTWGAIALFIAVPTALRWHFNGSVQLGDHIRDITVLRLDAIAFGVAIAALCRGRNPLAARPALMAGVGAAVIVEQWFQPFSLGWMAPHAFHVFFFTVPALGFALCLPAAARICRLPPSAAWAARLLSSQSYALYLVHFTMLAAITAAQSRYGLTGMSCVGISVVAIFGLSYGLHNWIEAPIMARRPKQYAHAHTTWDHGFRMEPAQSRSMEVSPSCVSPRLREQAPSEASG